ncbi:MAG: hypothetical protein AB1735_02405 [Pseudomonadota bacterium]
MNGPYLFGALPIEYVLTIVGVVLGGVFALLKWFAARMVAEIDTRLQRIEDLENRFERLMSDLPVHYQRRDDAIREYTVINVKLDRLYELMLRGEKNE